MKTIFWLFCTCLIVSSCSTSTPKAESSAAATQLSIPPELMFSLSQLTICEQKFWYSKYGQQVADKESTDVDAYFSALETKPKTCSLLQFIGSIQKASKIKKALEKDNPIVKDSSEKNIRRVKALQKVLAGTENSVAEFLMFSMILEQFNKNTEVKDPQLLSALAEAKNSFVVGKQNIFKTTVPYDMSVMQNAIYHMEIPDWQTMSLGATPTLLHPSDIQGFSRANKYEDVLNIEKFKNKVVENSKCLLEESCFICKLEIQSHKCQSEDDEQDLSSTMTTTKKYTDLVATLSRLEKRLLSKTQ